MIFISRDYNCGKFLEIDYSVKSLKLPELIDRFNVNGARLEGA
jgi:hypothetical protein